MCQALAYPRPSFLLPSFFRPVGTDPQLTYTGWSVIVWDAVLLTVALFCLAHGFAIQGCRHKVVRIYSDIGE